ncbi:MAG: DUF554 domain-containing protein [Chloroflexi bacterium]|nr:DUF554 domain-containing protein [Chloroflexota bacterium]
MIGTWINIAAVLAGGAVGLVLGARFPDRLRQTVIAALGLFTAGLGVRMFLQTEEPILALGGIALGAVLGEWWRIEDHLVGLGAWLERRFALRADEGAEGGRFVRGFLTSSLLFCVGPMTILGSVQDGLSGDYSLLAIKSVLDGLAAMALASTLGVGVLFSVLVIVVYQGGLTLLAAQVHTLLTDAMTAEMTAAGGLMLLGLAISSLLEIRRIRVGNLLPGLFVAPLLVAVQGPIARLFSSLVAAIGR